MKDKLAELLFRVALVAAGVFILLGTVLLILGVFILAGEVLP